MSINKGVLSRDSGGRVKVSTTASIANFNAGSPTALTGELVVRSSAPVRFIAGLGYDATGCLCVSDGGTPVNYKGGLAIAANGALCASSGGAIARYVGGLPVDSLGRLCATGLYVAVFPQSGCIEFLPLNGSLAVPVGTAPTGSVPFSTVGDGLSAPMYPQCALPAGANLLSLVKNANTYLLNDWTLCGWYYITATQSNGVLYQMGNCLFCTSYTHFYDGSVDKDMSLSELLNAWTFLIWRKSSTVASTVLRNNVQIATASQTTANSNSYSNVGVLRGQAPTNTNGLNGRASSIGMWNRVLTDQECTDLWNGGQGLKYPGT